MQLKKLLASLSLLFATGFATGCTGTNITVNPEPSTIEINNRFNCGSVAIKETVPSRIYPPAGNLVPDLARALDRSGMIGKVYYPSRPDDKVDLIIDAKFDVTVDTNAGANFAKSFFTGLFLFLPEPIIWYDFDYSASGQVDIFKENSRVATLNPQATAQASVKWLSLSSVGKLEGDTLAKLKDSMFKQTLLDLGRYCKKQ